MSYKEHKWPNGNLRGQEWKNERGELHRLDGAAIIGYYNNGTVYEEHWYRRGLRHRLEGPAFVYYYNDGEVASEYWYIEGNRVPPREGSLLQWAKVLYTQLGYLPSSLKEELTKEYGDTMDILELL